MFKVAGGRASGRTTKLIQYASEHNYILVEPTYYRAAYAREMAQKLGYNVGVIAAYQIFSIPRNGEKYFLVDDLDDFLSEIGVVGYSMLKEKGGGDNGN